MKINYDLIRDAFPQKAWVYAESHDAVRIGKWNGKRIVFCDDTFDEDMLLSLRVFDKTREIKFSGDKHRDTIFYDDNGFIDELADERYYMYGEQYKKEGDYTKLCEVRGKPLCFPALLDFTGKKRVGLMLCLKNFVRYNPVIVWPKDKDYNVNMNKSGAGAIEVIDYAYTGFCYDDGEEVVL